MESSNDANFDTFSKKSIITGSQNPTLTEGGKFFDNNFFHRDRMFQAYREELLNLLFPFQESSPLANTERVTVESVSTQDDATLETLMDTWNEEKNPEWPMELLGYYSNTMLTYGGVVGKTTTRSKGSIHDLLPELGGPRHETWFSCKY